METRTFERIQIGLALAFALFFAATVVPPLIESGDLVGAIAAGFVNPYAAGYSTDTVMCWVVLAVWVAYEAKGRGIRGGWACLLIGLVPGVATGFASYLVLRARQSA